MARRETSEDPAETANEAPVEQLALAADQAVPHAQPQDREPGVESEEPKREPMNWEPRTTIAVPLDEAAKADHTKGEVARYIDGYNAGVDVRIDSPDNDFRPSQHVNEPLKEDRKGRNRFQWKKRAWHKHVKNNPVGERLDAESRFEEMVQRRKAEINPDSGRDPF